MHVVEGAVGHGRRGGRGAEVLEGGLVVQGMRDHGLLGRRVRVHAVGQVVVVVIVVAVLLVLEVIGALEFVRATVLAQLATAAWREGVTYRRSGVLVALQEVGEVGGGVFVELVVLAEDDDGDVDGGEDGELVGLLEETALALEKGDGAVPIILDGLDLDFPAAHGAEVSLSRGSDDATETSDAEWVEARGRKGERKSLNLKREATVEINGRGGKGEADGGRGRAGEMDGLDRTREEGIEHEWREQ
jgi:hypothetical protein